MDSTPLDLSRVISVITENPQLIAEISALARADKKEEASNEKVQEEITEVPKQDAAQSIENAEQPTVTPVKRISETKNRQQLLSAFKPYLSSERAKAIDSMMSLAEILHTFSGR